MPTVFKILILLIFVAGFNVGYGQGINDSLKSKETQSDSIKIEQYFAWTSKIKYIDAYDFDLGVISRTEKNRDTVLLYNFLIANYDSVKLYDGFPSLSDELVKYVYAIDINGDNLLDIIYDGRTGGEPNITQIFVNKGNNYEKVFSGYQDIIKVDYSDNKLHSFTLINPGCCADPQIVEYYYSVSYAKFTPTFKLEKTIGYLSQTEKPENTLIDSIEFIVKTEKSKLRNDCYILDNVEFPLYGSNGNVIATYNVGSTGKMLGNKIDTGVEWVYVIMSSKNKLESCEYPAFIEQPTEIKGWMLKANTDLK